MKSNIKPNFISLVIFISLMMALVFPIGVLADDTTPPPTETPEVVPPTEEPVPDVSVTEVPVTEEVVGGEESGEPDLSQIVQTAAENDISLADPSGEALVMGSANAAETLTYGDPYFMSSGTLYRFLPVGGCAVYGGVSATCIESTTPIQAALTFSETHLPDQLIAPDGVLRRTIFVEPATYNEQLTINTKGLTLWGNPGDLTVVGAASSAPVLDGSTWASGDTGVTINAEGVTLIGFIIQNYDRAISQPIVVGSNIVTITQNTIRNNGEGIVILSDQGSPGTNVTYNVFQNNSSFDLVNGAPNDNNVQFVDAPNNYWGCATGPVVAYRIFTGSGQNRVWTGQWGYIDWATKHDYGINGNGDDPNSACAVLYGSDSLFNFQINTSAYSPYKINIGTFKTQIDTPALSLVKTATPTTYSAVGQVISYSYLVTNTGNVTLSGPFTVTDNKTTVTCPAGGLAPGASKTCTASYVITQADLDSGSVTNTARASANGTDSNQDSETVTAVRSTALTIVKTATPTTYSAVGQVISYSYLVTNTGNVTITGPFVVSDDKSIDETCPLTLSLAPGASITCTASYTITQADLNAGSVTNIASATNGAITSPTDTETVTAVRTSALTINKTATPATYSAVGQVISYSYLVTNTGNITLAGPVTVADNKVTVTCPAGELAPGASMTCTASYTITQADLDSGSVTNIAFASSGTVNSPTDSETVTAVRNPALAIVKTATPATYSAVGQVIGYNYLVTNTGNVTLSGPFTVTDNKATVACPPTASLVPGASITCTASYNITQADLNSGSVTNIASATNGTVTSPTDTETVTAVQTPALTIVKTASPGTYDSVGDIINYSYLVTNTGNVILAGPFTVTDDKAAVTCPGTASLAPGASITCNASYTVTQADLNAGSVTNVAFASNGSVTSLTDSETVNAVRRPALSIVKNASPNTYDASGDIISYSYLVTNTGNVTLAGPFTVTDDKTSVTCPATASLAPGASITCSASYIITQADLNAGSVTNIASASNGTVTSPTDSETVNAVQNTGLTILKTATPTTYSALGQVINYSYLVTNSSNITLNGPFTVTDNKAAVTCPATISLVPGASITCLASYTIKQADLDAGSVTNLAFASNGIVTSPTDSETVTAVQRSSLTIAKTASPTTYDSVGDVISYSYLVTNTGNVTLAGPVTVTDNKAIVTCPAGGLAPGATMTCTASYIITQADLDAGSVTNIAFAASGTVTSPTDSETVTAAQNPALTILKTATPTTYSAVGQVISYSYLVTNSGNVTLAGPVTVTDDKATVTCPAGGLAPGASLICTASYTVTQADLNTGSVTNIAFAASGNVTSPTDTETATAAQNPSISTLKTVTSTGPYVVGNTITYEIVVTNTGNVTLTGVTAIDNNAQMGTCTPAQPSTLAPGASMTCSASHTVTAEDVNSGRYVNTATGDSDQTAPNTSAATVNFTPAPPTTPPTNPTPARPSVSFTGFIPVTGGEMHAIAAGNAHTCAIMPDGDIECWGNNDHGQLGDGTNTGSNIPVDVANIGGGITIVAGGNHTCVLTGGEVWCWGQNSEGQLGDGTRMDRNVPVRAISGAVDITAGLDYTCAVMQYGQVMCWGNNDQGQLADGTRVDQTTPTLATLISTISNIDAGRTQSCGLTVSGLLRCVNRGTAQDLGGFIPVTGDSPEATLDVAVNRFGPLVMALLEEGMPVEFLNGQFNAIADVTDAIDVDSGVGHVCALVENGTVSCWGSNSYGQLGRNTLESSQDPQPVLNVSNAWQLAVGRNHACVLITSSTPGTNDIQCWGLNSDGQLGDGTYVNSPVPVYVK